MTSSATQAQSCDGKLLAFSVIIPAHREEKVISRCLRSFEGVGSTGRAQVVVVCNGCDDGTAGVARDIAPWAIIVETDVPSKVNALNLGDQATTAFPRIYVDADVVLDSASAEQLLLALREETSLAVAPRAHLDLTGSSRAVRAFYQIDRSLPWSREGIGGTGVYALSAAGRARFGPFPAITSDDGFVRTRFRPEERRQVAEAVSTVTAPRTLRDLVAIKTRSHFGTYELLAKYPEARQHVGSGNREALLRLAANPLRWPSLAVYFYVKTVAKRRALRRFRSVGEVVPWERDESSRGSKPARKSQ